MRYQTPELISLGSITEHTFTVCNPSGGPIEGIPGPFETLPGGGRPPKGPADVPHHIDKFGECSALS